MKSKITHRYWHDAKEAAQMASLEYGFGYIIGREAPYSVAACELAEEAPTEFSTEFKDGVEQ